MNIGDYLNINTDYGTRTIKYVQDDSDGMPYGVFSPSDFVVKGDNQGMMVPYNGTPSTAQQIIDWDTWYN